MVFAEKAALAISLIAMLLGLPAAAPDVDRPMNLLVVTVDTFRPDHTGAYGYHRDTTPSLDAFAAEAAVFPNAFAVSAWTFPGIVSTLTGVYPPSHGYDARGRAIREGTPTLQARMRDADYSVPAISYVSGIPGIEALQVEDPPPWLGPGRERAGRLLQWLGSEEAHDQPFFVWYHYRGLHLPYDPEPPNDSLFGTVPTTPGLEQVRQYVVIPAELQNFMPEDHSAIVDLYDGTLREFDDFWADLLSSLDRNGLLDRTLIVLTADHGEELMEHGLVGHASTTTHATMYDEILRIPLIIRAPGEILQAPECQVSQVDVMPTVLSLLGLSTPADLEGRDLSGTLRGEEICANAPVFAESILGGFQARDDTARAFVWAVRTPDWKLIRRRSIGGSESHELYNLAADPGEHEDLYDEDPGQAERLGLLLDGYFTAHGGPDYWQETVEEAPPARRVVTEVVSPPRPLSPEDGSRLSFDESSATIAGEWTGSPTATYIVEYDVGVEQFRTTGQIRVVGTRLEFGPAPLDIWNSLAQFNPWRFRVWLEGAPDRKSDWISFSVEPSDAG